MSPELWHALLWPLVMVTAVALAALVHSLAPRDEWTATHATERTER